MIKNYGLQMRECSDGKILLLMSEVINGIILAIKHLRKVILLHVY